MVRLGYFLYIFLSIFLNKLNGASLWPFSVLSVKEQRLNRDKTVLNVFKPAIYREVQLNVTNLRLQEQKMKVILNSIVFLEQIIFQNNLATLKCQIPLYSLAVYKYYS